MLVSPDGRSLVLTGKPNTLQWYQVEQDGCEFELPVLHAAVVPRGRLTSAFPTSSSGVVSLPNINQKLTIPSRVELAVFGRQYLATLDVRSGNKKFKVTTERTLKIWRPKSSGIGCELACVVLRPHRKLVSYLAGSSTGDEFCSTSSDKTWKLWRVQVGEKGESSVSCIFSRGYKDLKPSCCCFSSDGSLLAVVFQGSVLTLWSPVSGLLLRELSVGSPSHKTVAVAAVPSSSLLVGLVHGRALWCLDVLSMSVRWRLSIKVFWRELCVDSNFFFSKGD
jgi:WD40 repeat protein